LHSKNNPHFQYTNPTRIIHMSYRPDSKITVIVIHYSATSIENDYSSTDIDKMHRNRGFNEIGYHIYIRKDGTEEFGRDLTQPGRFEQGAHSQGENDSSIGVCFEGGVRRSDVHTGFDSRTPEQLATMIKVIDRLQLRYTGSVVKGHRDMPEAATQCPGFNATLWWDSVVTERNKPTETSSYKVFTSFLGQFLSLFGGKS
jgi:N-acetylmuramoyl-L-alanine amidase